MSTATLFLMYIVDLRHANPGLRHQHPQPFLVIYLLANQQKPKPANAFSPEVSTRYGHDTDNQGTPHESRYYQMEFLRSTHLLCDGSRGRSGGEHGSGLLRWMVEVCGEEMPKIFLLGRRSEKFFVEFVKVKVRAKFLEAWMPGTAGNGRPSNPPHGTFNYWDPPVIRHAQQ